MPMYLNNLLKIIISLCLILLQLLSRMTPSRSQLLLALADGKPGKEKITLSNMELSLINLRKNVTALKQFYNDHDLEVITVV